MNKKAYTVCDEVGHELKLKLKTVKLHEEAEIKFKLELKLCYKYILNVLKTSAHKKWTK